MVNHIYDAAGYEIYIYQGDPEPPLMADQQAWARPFVPVSK